MGGGNPTVPENMMGTLTSSDHNFAHMSNPTNVRHRYCAVATLACLEPLLPLHYMRIVAFSPDSLGAFFYGETFSIRCNTTMKYSSLAKHMKASYSSLRVSIYD